MNAEDINFAVRYLSDIVTAKTFPRRFSSYTASRATCSRARRTSASTRACRW